MMCSFIFLPRRSDLPTHHTPPPTYTHTHTHTTPPTHTHTHRYGVLLRKGENCDSVEHNSGSGGLEKVSVVGVVMGVALMLVVVCGMLLLLYFFYYPMGESCDRQMLLSLEIPIFESL